MAPPRPARPSPLACDRCRRRHLKCDAVSPTCGRCSAEGGVCAYTPSQRGMKRRKESRKTVSDITAQRLATSSPTTNFTEPMAFTESASYQSNEFSETPTIGQQASTNTHATPLPSDVLSDTDREYLIDLYYTRFHAAHPLLVPQAFYNVEKYPKYLDLVVCFIGHQYADSMPNAAVLEHAVSQTMFTGHEQTVNRVQALLLYAIILHARQNLKDAESCIARAAEIALTLGMNQPSFARDNSGLNQVVEESLRRTWWELYVVDCFVAALHRRPTFQTKLASTHPLLPCAELVYEAGSTSTHPVSLQDFDERVFALNTTVNFSTWCHRIEAIRIVERVLALAATKNAHPDSIQSVDNALASWKYNLQPFQSDAVDPSGEVDQMLFQAHLFIQCASIFLHFPRSDLPATVPLAATITCVKGYTKGTPTSTQHTAKAIAASKELSNLAAIPWPLDKHSPFFVCGLILGCIVQLAAASIHVHVCGYGCLQQHRDRVVLMLSVLKCLSQRWTIAQNAVHCLKLVSKTIFTSQESQERMTGPSAPDSGVELNDLPNNISWLDLFSAEEF